MHQRFDLYQQQQRLNVFLVILMYFRFGRNGQKSFAVTVMEELRTWFVLLLGYLHSYHVKGCLFCLLFLLDWNVLDLSETAD